MRKLNYALSDYQQAGEVSGNDHNIAVRIAQVSYELGKVAFNRDDKEDAIHWLSMAIHHCPQVAAFYTARARAHFAFKVLVVDRVCNTIYNIQHHNVLIVCTINRSCTDSRIYNIIMIIIFRT